MSVKRHPTEAQDKSRNTAGTKEHVINQVMSHEQCVATQNTTSNMIKPSLTEWLIGSEDQRDVRLLIFTDLSVTHHWCRVKTQNSVKKAQATIS